MDLFLIKALVAVDESVPLRSQQLHHVPFVAFIHNNHPTVDSKNKQQLQKQ